MAFPGSSGLTSLTDLVPGALRTAGGAARASSQYPDPMQQLLPPLPEDPREKMLRRILGPSYVPVPRPRSGEEYKYPPLTEEEQASLWENLGSAGMSALGAVGGFLDKYTGSRALRALIGGVSGQVPWSRAGREMLSFLPLTDYLGATDEEETVWSKDLTGRSGGGWSWLNFGLDVLLDPTLPLTFGAKAASRGGLKVLNKSGHADDFFDAIKSGKYGDDIGMGVHEAKLKYTIDDVFDWAEQEAKLPGRADDAARIQSDLLVAMESEGLTRPLKAGEDTLFDAYEAAAEHAAGRPVRSIIDEKVLSEPLGGLVGFGVPFKSPVSAFGTGPMSQAMAHGLDATKAAIADAPVMRSIIALYDHKMRGALTRMGRSVASRTTRRGESEIARQWSDLLTLKDAIWRSDVGGLETMPVRYRRGPGGGPEVIVRRDPGTLLPEGVKFGDMFDSSVVGAERAAENHRALRSYLEGVEELPEWARGFGLEERFQSVKNLFDGAANEARSYGVVIPDLDDVINYIPRARHSVGIFDKGGKGLRVYDVSSPHAIGRAEPLKYHPGGTEVLQRISLDENISGALHRMARTRGGTLRRLPEEEMERLRKYIIDNYWDELYGGDFAKHYNPPEHLWPGSTFPDEINLPSLSKDQLNHIVDPIIHWASKLDPRHVAKGEAAFKLNPMDDIISYIESVTQNTQAARAVHELLAEGSGFHSTLDAGVEAIPVAEALREVGLEGPEAIRAFYRTALGNRLAYERIIGRGVSLDDMRRWIEEVPDESLKLGVSREAQDLLTKAGEPFEPLLVPRTIVDEAKRYLKPFSNPAELNAFIRAFDIFTNAFKTSVTTLFPAFHTRNFISGTFNNYVSGMKDPRFMGPRAYWQPLADANTLMAGGVIKGAGDIRFVDNEGRIITGLTDEEATRRVMAMVYSHNVFRRGGRVQDPTEVITSARGGETAVGLEGEAARLRTVMPLGAPPRVKKPIYDAEGNLIPENIGEMYSGEGRGFLAGAGARIIGVPAAAPSVSGVAAALAMPQHYVPSIKGGPSLLEKFEEFLPWNIRGVVGDETKFFLARWGEDTAAAIEGLNRIAPFVSYLRQGISPAEAARKVKAAQVDYSAMTQFERRVMKRIFPFYSFTRRITPYVVEQLVQRPSGAIAQVLRESARLREKDSASALLPSWVTRGTAIPLGGKDGHDKYLMSLGLAHEDPLTMLYLGKTPWQTISGTTRQVLSRINPLPKSIIEAATGKTLYGGADIRFQKPAWAYAGQNLAEAGVPGAGTFFGDDPWFKPSPTKTLLANINPFSTSWPGYAAFAATRGYVPYGSPRHMTLDRILTDPRKGWGKIGSTLTGFKIGDVDVARSRNLALIDRLKDMLVENPNVLRAEKMYTPDFNLLSPRDQLLMRGYQQQTREMQRLSRDRKKRELIEKIYGS